MKKQFLTLLALLTVSSSLVGCNSNSSEGLTIVHFDQTILGETSKELGVSIGIKKGNTDLQTKLNSALEKIDATTRTNLMIQAVNRSSGTIDENSIITTNPSKDDASKEDLIIGLECNYSPFNWTETTESQFTYPIEGKTNEFAEGYDIQIAKMLANTLNMNLKVVKMQWDSLIPSLQNDTINAVIAGMTDTEERRQSIDFTSEYYRSELVLVTRKGSKFDKGDQSANLADYKDARFVSQVSTVTNDVIDTWVKDYGVIHLNPMDTFATCAIAVKNGSADIMTAELPVAQAIVGSN